MDHHEQAAYFRRLNRRLSKRASLAGEAQWAQLMSEYHTHLADHDTAAATYTLQLIERLREGVTT